MPLRSTCRSLLWIVPTIGLCASASLVLTVSAAGAAGHHRILYSFCQSSGCPDGITPFNGLATDGSGSYFGTTTFGGNSSYHGTIYSIVMTNKGWKFHSLYDFCSQTNCQDGGIPGSPLIVDKSGNLYGTAEDGGMNGNGVVFELTKKGTYRVLYNFCTQPNCADGRIPSGALTYKGAETGALYDGSSTLYGTTGGGGANNVGAVYGLKGGNVVVLYSFNSTGDGYNPESGLAIDGSGTLYGTTTAGGQSGSGTIYSVSGSGEVILHNFCSRANCVDGGAPGYGEPVVDSSGALFGTTPAGGKFGGGLVYELAGGTYKILYDFCTRKNTCPTGALPQGAVTLDGSGNLYGVTPEGGAETGNGGVVFQLNGSLKVLYSFCNNTNCPDGGAPYSKVLLDTAGDIFGTTTQGGGALNGGTIFELTP
jgi:uncharacterized repeat protein (TIGR03803 family)